MATLFPGYAPEILTVSASPTPTSTVFTVSSATNLIVGQWINVKVSSAFQRAKITNISSNQLTVTGLSGAPDTPGEVRNTRTLIAVSHIQSAGLFEAADVADLKTVDTTYAPAGLKYVLQTGEIYRWQTGTGLTADDDAIVTSDYSGQWVKISGSSQNDLDLTEQVGELQAQINDQRIILDKLVTPVLGSVLTDIYLIPIVTTYASISATTDNDLTIPIVPGYMTELNPYLDSVSVSLPILPAGIAFCGAWIGIDSKSIVIRLRNNSGGAITIGRVNFIIKIERLK